MYPFADEGPGDTLWELGLDFTVSPGKTGFRGAEEHYRLKGKERFKIFGVLLEGSVAADPGDRLFADDKQVGVITCPMVSSLTGKSMAIARLDVPYAVHGTRLSVEGNSGRIPAAAHTLPFDDPEKKKRTA
jgi:aminomethyltransferase